MAVGRSLGSGPTYPKNGDGAVLNVALDNMAKAGLKVVVAAGNEGGFTGGIGL